MKKEFGVKMHLKMLVGALAIWFALGLAPFDGLGLSLQAEAAGDVLINETNFPDANFREYVSENFDKDKNGSLSESEIASVTEIKVYNKKISSLKGVEYFTALKHLDCDKNQLTSLDVSKNTMLEYLDCSNNQLTSLDVNNCTSLGTFFLLL